MSEAGNRITAQIAKGAVQVVEAAAVNVGEGRNTETAHFWLEAELAARHIACRGVALLIEHIVAGGAGCAVGGGPAEEAVGLGARQKVAERPGQDCT